MQLTTDRQNISSDHKSAIAVWFPVIIFLVNFFLKLPFLTSNDIAIDEPFTIYHSQKDWNGIYEMLQTENNPPLYYLFMHYWTMLFGTGVFSARFPSLMFSSISAVLVFKLGQRFFNLRTGIIATIIYTGSTLHTFFSHDARVYALFFLLSVISIYLFLTLSENRKNSGTLFYLMLCNIILCYSHFFGFIIVALEALCIVVIPELRQYIRKFILSLAGLTLAYSFYFPVMLKRFNVSSGGTWVEKPIMSDLYTMLWRFSNVPLLTVTFIIILAAGIFRIYYKKENNIPLSILMICFIISYFGLFVLSFSIPVFLDRYLLFVSLYYYLLVSIAINSMLPLNRNGWFLAFILPLVMIFTLKLNPSKKRNIRELVDYIKEKRNPGDVIVISPEWFNLNFVYYYKPEWFKDTRHLNDSLEANHIFPVNNIGQLPEEKYKKATSLFYIDTGSEATDPQNEIYNSLKNNFPSVNKHSVYENLNIYQFQK